MVLLKGGPLVFSAMYDGRQGERSIWWGHAGSDMVESLEGNVGYHREKSSRN